MKRRGGVWMFFMSGTHLNHKLPNDAMKDGVVIVSIASMRHEILDRLRRGIRKQPDVDIAVRRMQHGRGARLDGSRLGLGLGRQIAWFLVLHVALGLRYPIAVGVISTMGPRRG